MSKKKFLVLACTSIVALAACGGGPTSTSSGGGVPSVDPYVDDTIDDVSYDGNGDIVFDNVKLKMWSVCTDPDAAYQDEIINDFNTAYKGQIEVEIYHESRYTIFGNFAKTVSQDPNNAPDLFYGYGERIGAMVSNKLFVPMDIYLEAANIGFNKSYFEPILIDNCYVSGYLYGLPISVDTSIAFCRKDILTKNNLEVPYTYAELMDVCNALVSKANAGELWVRGNDTANVALGNVYEWRKYDVEVEGTYYPFPISPGDMWVNAYIAQTAALQNGGILVDENGMPAYNTMEVANGLQLLRDWLIPTETSANNTALSKIDLNYDAGVTDFYAGTSAFYLAGAWDGYGNTARMDTMYAADGGSSNTMAIINPSELFAADLTKDYAKHIFGDSHAVSIVKTVTSRTKRIAAAVFSNYLAENCGGVWIKAGHLPASLVVQQSNDLYLNNEFYLKYVQYYGTTDLYRTMPVTVYYDFIMESFGTALKKAMLSRYREIPISQLLQESYDDCIARIRDLEEL
ncbi:MAG: ABC transporter substrate-binding protein [Bacilli bacterium]|jgi:ABC-type glycerol-3-phosphate transport system substrate-binding protein